jgi:hypothetical protein
MISKDNYNVNEIKKVLKQYNIKYIVLERSDLQDYVKKFKMGVIQ